MRKSKAKKVLVIAPVKHDFHPSHLESLRRQGAGVINRLRYPKAKP
jgi:hypothetical protein